jgi:hypothetical protein
VKGRLGYLRGAEYVASRTTSIALARRVRDLLATAWGRLFAPPVTP